MAKYIDAEKLAKAIEDKGLDCSFALKMERLDTLALIDSLQQEQSESSKGKFVFPNFLYARTVDNKTIDVSYVPQSMDAVEYIKNDHTEQPEVDFEKELKNERAILLDDAFGPMNGEQSLAVKNFARHFYELGLNARKEESK